MYFESIRTSKGKQTINIFAPKYVQPSLAVLNVWLLIEISNIVEI